MPYRDFALAVLRGLGQLAFSDRAAAGALILAAIAVSTPAGAVAALIGCIASTAAAMLRGRAGTVSWHFGTDGMNGALVGLLWAAPLAGDLLLWPAFAAALALCTLSEVPLRRLFGRINLPIAGTPALLVVWASSTLFEAFGFTFWSGDSLLPFGQAGAALTILLVVAAMVATNRTAALQTVVLAGAAALVSGMVFGVQGLGPVGLWGFAVAPATFAVFGAYMPESRIGSLAGIVGGLAAAAAWGLWQFVPGPAVLQPLMAPCFIGLWTAIAAARVIAGRHVADPALAAIARMLSAARASGHPAIALTGAGISTASGIPDYTTGDWLDPDIPVANYGFRNFRKSSRCREQYWDACNRFRDIAAKAAPNAAHRALAALGAAGYIRTVLTQNVDGLHQAAGSGDVIDLHGTITKVVCTECDHAGPWPRRADWRARELLCEDCGGLLKPAVIAMEEDLVTDVWGKAQMAALRTGGVLVVGSRLTVSSAVMLLELARQNGAGIAIVNRGPVAGVPGPEDVVFDGLAEEALPALAALLDCDLPDEAPAQPAASDRPGPAKARPKMLAEDLPRPL